MDVSSKPINENRTSSLVSELRPSRLPVSILGIAFDPVQMEEALEVIDQMVRSGNPHYIVTPNVDFVVQAQRDEELHNILLDAHLVLCDGMPLVWASRWLGNPIPERVAGADLVPLLLRQASSSGQSVFLLGASPEASARAVERLRIDYPQLVLAGSYSPPFKPLDEMDNEFIIEAIQSAKPDILLVSFGCPKQEKWIARNYKQLNIPVCIGVGAVIDFLGGSSSRAPGWMGEYGLEWLYRMCQEPGRLCSRYANDLRRFAPAICMQYWRTRIQSRSALAGGSITITHSDASYLHARVLGRLDRAAIESDPWTWREIGANGHNCTLNLCNVDSIDSTGVALLIGSRQRLKSSGRSLILEEPSKSVQQTLILMGLRNFFDIDHKSSAGHARLGSA